MQMQGSICKTDQTPILNYSPLCPNALMVSFLGARGSMCWILVGACGSRCHFWGSKVSGVPLFGAYHAGFCYSINALRFLAPSYRKETPPTPSIKVATEHKIYPWGEASNASINRFFFAQENPSPAPNSIKPKRTGARTKTTVMSQLAYV